MFTKITDGEDITYINLNQVESIQVVHFPRHEYNSLIRIGHHTYYAKETATEILGLEGTTQFKNEKIRPINNSSVPSNTNNSPYRSNPLCQLDTELGAHEPVAGPDRYSEII